MVLVTTVVSEYGTAVSCFAVRLDDTEVRTVGPTVVAIGTVLDMVVLVDAEVVNVVGIGDLFVRGFSGTDVV